MKIKQRQPRELLKSLFANTVRACLHAGPGVWREAAKDAAGQLRTLMWSTPPDKPKRHYFGKPGSLTYPHHRKP